MKTRVNPGALSAPVEVDKQRVTITHLSPRMARPVVGGTVRDTASTYDRVEDVYRSVSRRMWQALFAYSGDPGTANLFVVDNRLMQWSTDEQPTADEGAG